MSLLNLTRTSWDLAYAIQYDIGYDPSYTTIPLFVLILYPILYTWVTAVIFTLVIVIGSKKSNGLWSQGQVYGDFRPGQGISTSQPIGTGSYMQPTQPGIVIGISPPWRPELSGTTYINPTQQYYGTQYQQQLPIVQSQPPQAYQVAGT